MRSILFLVLFTGFSITTFSQDDNRRPTQQEIQVQKQQAIAKAQKTRDETKKQLAEAKADNEDPEAIKRIESRLASLDQMIAMLENTDLKNSKTQKTLPPSKTQEPDYVSPFTPIKLNQPVKIPTQDQAKDKLLWYSGRSIDANTLIIPSGLIVRYDRQRNTITFQPPRQGSDPDTIYYSLIKTLGQIKQMRNDYAVRMDNMPNSFFMFPEIEKAYKEYDLFKDRHYDLAKNTVKIETQRPDADIEIKIQNLMDLMDNLPPVQITVPPKRPNNLCLCNDPAAIAEYEAGLQSWLIDFYSTEKKIKHMIMALFEHIELYRRSGRSYPIPFDAAEVIGFITKMFDRMKQKLEQLSQKYEQGDVLLEDGLVKAAIDLNRTLNLMGNIAPAAEPAINNLFHQIREAVESSLFETYIEANKSIYNYDVVFDYGLYVSHELNKAAFSVHDVNTVLFQTWMEGLKKYNRFHLAIELDFHYQLASESGQVSMYANGLLKSENNLYVSLGRKDCHWELYLTDVDHRNLETSGEEFTINMKVMQGEKDYFNDRKPAFPYSGPNTLKMVFPGFKIDFCGGESEAKMDIASYTSDDAKRHENDDVKSMYTMDILAYVNKMLLSLKKTELNVDQLISTAGEMMNMKNSQVPISSRDPALAQMEMLYKKNKEKSRLQHQLAQVSHTGRTIIKLTLSDNTSLRATMFDPIVDVADPNDEDRKKGIMLTKGIVNMRIIHSPGR